MSTTHVIPDPSLWLSPISWIGSPPQPVQNYSRDFSAACTFVRGELIVTMAQIIGSGMTRETQESFPALIRIEDGKPVDVHSPSPDQTYWTLRATKTGRKTLWRLHEGESFPAETLIEIAFERAIVQSILPAEGSRKYISFMILDDGTTQNLSHERDSDQGD